MWAKNACVWVHKRISGDSDRKRWLCVCVGAVMRARVSASSPTTTEVHFGRTACSCYCTVRACLCVLAPSAHVRIRPFCPLRRGRGREEGHVPRGMATLTMPMPLQRVNRAHCSMWRLNTHGRSSQDQTSYVRVNYLYIPLMNSRQAKLILLYLSMCAIDRFLFQSGR